MTAAELLDHPALVALLGAASAFLLCFLAVLGLFLSGVVAFVAISTGRAIVAIALAPAALVFLAFHIAIKHTDKSWRYKGD